jgi:outer membrane lipoprotein-sorting protein
MKKAVIQAIIILLPAAGCCPAATNAVAADANSVRETLKKLEQQTAKLNSYEGQIEYLFSQPLLDSKTLRKGVLYYQRTGEKTLLRINFETLKQDEGPEQKYVEHFIFDGAWLTHIDYQIKTVERRQLAEPNDAIDVFELASKNFPIVGFAETGELEKQFEIKPAVKQAGGLTGLYLKPKADSIYKNNYTSIEFWIDERYYLPARITAVSTEKDIYEIRFNSPKVNKGIDKAVFEVKIPEGFGEQIIPLKKKELDKKQE